MFNSKIVGVVSSKKEKKLAKFGISIYVYVSQFFVKIGHFYKCWSIFENLAKVENNQNFN